MYRLSSELGSGEFGVVWSVGGGEREVAIKSLADGFTEEKRIHAVPAGGSHHVPVQTPQCHHSPWGSPGKQTSLFVLIYN